LDLLNPTTVDLSPMIAKQMDVHCLKWDSTPAIGKGHPPSRRERESSGHDFREALFQSETAQIGDPAKYFWTMESNRIANAKVDCQSPEPPILSTNPAGVPTALNCTDNAASRICG
jgi:hypothetical protein